MMPLVHVWLLCPLPLFLALYALIQLCSILLASITLCYIWSLSMHHKFCLLCFILFFVHIWLPYGPTAHMQFIQFTHMCLVGPWTYCCVHPTLISLIMYCQGFTSVACYKLNACVYPTLISTTMYCQCFTYVVCYEHTICVHPTSISLTIYC